MMLQLGYALYKMDLDGSNTTLLKNLETDSNILCEFDNWIFIADNNDSEGRFELVSKDGKQNIILFKLDLTRIYRGR